MTRTAESDAVAGVPTVPTHDARRQFVEVLGFRTHYLEVGSGPPVVLLHSGEFGACGEFSFEYNLAALAAHFRVLVPDWLGFGDTAKIFDFEDSHRRSLLHIAAFCREVGVDRAPFVGNSMSGLRIMKDLTDDEPLLPISAAVNIAGAGAVPMNEWRQVLQDYDCTVDGMRRVLEANFNDPVWWNDADYVRRRYERSLVTGGWECLNAARLMSPARRAVATDSFKQGWTDRNDYSRVRVPVLLIKGTHDKLKMSDWAPTLRASLTNTDVEVLEVPEAGHMPHIEAAATVNPVMVEFLMRFGRQ